MQKEYITKNRAKHFVCGYCNEVCSEEPCEPRDCDWMAFIDKEPAADVVEVRHGQWESTGALVGLMNFEYFYRCTACGRRGGDTKTNYCPNCGAKMDGGKHE